MNRNEKRHDFQDDTVYPTILMNMTSHGAEILSGTFPLLSGDQSSSSRPLVDQLNCRLLVGAEFTRSVRVSLMMAELADVARRTILLDVD